MFGSQPRHGGIDLGLSGPIPKDVLVLLVATFLTYSLSAFDGGRRLVDLLQLSPDIWRQGFLWQLVTYPFATAYSGPIFLLLSLWMILIFGKQVFYVVGRRAFWRHFFITALTAGSVAVVAQTLISFTGPLDDRVVPFGLLQGRDFILTFLITGFAALFGHATIYLMFVLPVKASWFVGLEFLFAFLYFLSYKDLAGFIGLCTVIGVAYLRFSGRGPRFFHEMRLRLERKWLERKLRKLKGSGGTGGVVQGPWVN